MIWIAEIGSNHDSNLGRANELIYQAKEVGATHVKFQMFNGEIGKPEREWLNPDWLPVLSAQTHYYGMQFGCSPFYLEAVKILEPYVDFYKLTSNYGMVNKLGSICLATGKHVIFSYHADKIAPGYWHWSLPREDIKILVTVPKYPTAISDAQLGEIPWARFHGWSDHTRSPGVIYRVVHHYNAQVIEFHLDLEDGQGWEYHYGHCWLPDEIKEVIKNVKEGFEADCPCKRERKSDGLER